MRYGPVEIAGGHFPFFSFYRPPSCVSFVIGHGDAGLDADILLKSNVKVAALLLLSLSISGISS